MKKATPKKGNVIAAPASNKARGGHPTRKVSKGKGRGPVRNPLNASKGGEGRAVNPRLAVGHSNRTPPKFAAAKLPGGASNSGENFSPPQKKKQSPAKKKPVVTSRESDKPDYPPGEERLIGFEEHKGLAELLEQGLHELIRQAKHEAFQLSMPERFRFRKQESRRAIRSLVGIAARAVSELNNIASSNPESVRPFSRRVKAWPILFSHKRAMKNLNAKLVEDLQLNADPHFVSNREWQIESPSGHAAHHLLLMAIDLFHEGHLPDLSTETKVKWFESSWQAWLSSGFKPEENEWLKPLGKAAIGKKSTSRGMSEQTEGMKRDDVRARIKAEIWKAFDTLAAGGIVGPRNPPAK